MMDSRIDRRGGKSEPGAKAGAPMDRSRASRLADEIARENTVTTGNGNRENPSDDKGTDAQHGGPDLAKADKRQPPEATRRPLPRSES